MRMHCVVNKKEKVYKMTLSLSVLSLIRLFFDLFISHLPLVLSHFDHIRSCAGFHKFVRGPRLRDEEVFTTEQWKERVMRKLIW